MILKKINALALAAWGSLRVKIREKTNPYLAPWRRSKLKGTDFTIISNNCWGAHVYRYFGLPYSSPTIGLYFPSHDYVKFCSNLDHYLNSEITVSNTIPPIGHIDDVEIVFLHYKSKEEVIEKWSRRKERMFHNILLKYSFQNEATLEDLKTFVALPYKNKIAFVPTKELASIDPCCIYFPGYEKEGQVLNDTTRFRDFVNLKKLINKIYS